MTMIVDDFGAIRAAMSSAEPSGADDGVILDLCDWASCVRCIQAAAKRFMLREFERLRLRAEGFGEVVDNLQRSIAG